MSDLAKRIEQWIEEKYPIRGTYTGELLREAVDRIRELEAVIESETLWLDYVPEQTAPENWFGLFRIDGEYWRANSWGRDDSWRMFPLIRVPDDHATTLMGTLPTDEEADDE